jgi:hypothetical protein
MLMALDRRILFPLVVLLGLASGQFALSKSSVRAAVDVPSVLVVDPQMGRLLGGPYSELWSAVQWVDVIFEYAEGVVGSGKLDGLAHRIRIAAALDPQWIQPVEFAGLVLDGQNGTRIQDGVDILKDGLRRFPNRWRIRVYLAMLMQSQQVPVDSVVAILLPLAHDSVDAPAYVKKLPITLLALNGNGRDAIEFLSQAIKETREPMIRYQFEGKVSDLLRRTGVDLGADHADFVASANQLLAMEGPESDQAKGLLVGLLDSTTRQASLPEARRMAAQWREYRRSTTAPESESSKSP